MSKEIIFPLTPITEETFERQGWLRFEDTDDEGEDYYYWVLPLPKDNPDENCPVFISSCNDDYEELNISKGEYFVEIEDFFGLGFCQSEEELEILYRALTKSEIEPIDIPKLY